MRLFTLILFLFWQAGAIATSPQAERQYFLYQRSIVPAAAGLNCAVLDADVFAHGGVSLKDLRLFPRPRRRVRFPMPLP